MVFNLFEGNLENTATESYVAGLLEWKGIPFTGSPMHTLSLARAKHLTKPLLRGAGLPTADFMVVNELPVPACNLEWPVIVKPAQQDASVGLDQESVCTNQLQLDQRAQYILETYGPPVLVEEFIHGREFNVALVELPELQALPPAEIVFPADRPGFWPILTYDGKWKPGTDDYEITPPRYPADISPRMADRLGTIAKQAYRLLGCKDYARVDFRMKANGKPFILEVNPNPEISESAGFAGCLGSAKIAPQRIHRPPSSPRSEPAVRSGPELCHASLPVPANCGLADWRAEVPVDPKIAYDELIGLFKQTRMLDSIGSVLGWDERTYMPPKGAAHRAEQMGLLARLGHDELASPRIGELLGQLDASALTKDGSPVPAANVREIRRLHDLAVKVPSALVEELARTTSRAQGIWQEARKNSDFKTFAPWLEKIVNLKRQEAQALGYRDVPYDALLDQYEPGATTAEVTRLFAELRADLVPLVAKITSSQRTPRQDFLQREYPLDRQHLFGQAAAAAIGFDFTAGRLDTTVHPFCSGMGPGDCRLTTRYDAHQFNQGFFGILHEAGHGIYEQGLDPELFGTPAGSAASLGIHESQSRLWENQVGRSRPFWEHFLPRASKCFPARSMT